MLNVEDTIGVGCPYADFTEFTIKTHINGTKALQEAIKKLDTEQTNFRNLAVFKVLKEAN